MKEKIIEWMKTNTISIAILIAIIAYMIARYSFSQGTIQYRVDAIGELEEMEQRIDNLTEEIKILQEKVDELNK